MKDLTLKFPGNREFKSFLSSLDWEEDEDLQNKLLVDEIGFTYTETGVTEEGEPVCIRNNGYFVNIRILDDLFESEILEFYSQTLQFKSLMLKELNFVMNYVFTLETWYLFFVLRRQESVSSSAHTDCLISC